MLNHRPVLPIVGLICFGLLGLACENGHSSYSPQSGVNANKSDKPATAAQLTEADRAFAIKAATGNKQEVELGRLAATQASNADVKAFANRMVQDHSRALEELTQINSKLGVVVPSDEDASFKQTVDRLSKLKGAEFDRTYMSEMVAGHTKVADAFSSYANSGTNSDLKAWASKTLPTTREHLKMAQDISNKLGAPKK